MFFINKQNACLVHVTSKIPSAAGLISGLNEYKSSATGREYNEETLRQSGLALSFARKTLHFTISHVVPSHAERSTAQDRLAIIIPVRALPSDCLSKMQGGPEDIFLFTEVLSLQGLDATLLIPESLKGTYLASELKQTLGQGIHATTFKDLSLSQAFIQYAQKKGFPYLEPAQYLNNDPENQVLSYRVFSASPTREVAQNKSIQDITAQLLPKERFLMAHVLHPLAHIEQYLSLLTEIYLGNTGSPGFRASVEKSFPMLPIAKWYQYSYDTFQRDILAFLETQPNQEYADYYLSPAYPRGFEAFRQAVSALLKVGSPEAYQAACQQYFKAMSPRHPKLVDQAPSLETSSSSSVPTTHLSTDRAPEGIHPVGWLEQGLTHAMCTVM